MLAGWLELRKGVHTYLTASGDLVILRDHTLRANMNTVTSSTTLNQRRQQMLSQAKKVPNIAATVAALQGCVDTLHKTVTDVAYMSVDVRTGEVHCDAQQLCALGKAEYGGSVCTDVSAGGGNMLCVGPWQVSVSFHHTDANDAVTSPSTPASCADMRTVEAILPGTFTYDIPITTASATVASDYKVELRLQFQLDAITSAVEELQLQQELYKHLSAEAPGAGTAGVPLPGVHAAAGSHCSSDLPVDALISTDTTTVTVAPAGVQLMEGRLRHGLPLLVVTNCSGCAGGSGSSGNSCVDSCVLRFEYTNSAGVVG